ncbi:hypothetical protein MAHJHV47_46470 [Mycobacterium avium subsp. hominissuis]
MPANALDAGVVDRQAAAGADGRHPQHAVVEHTGEQHADRALHVLSHRLAGAAAEGETR